MRGSDLVSALLGGVELIGDDDEIGDELLGDEDEIGDELLGDELLGARRRRRKRRLAAPRRHDVIKRAPTIARKGYLPMGAATAAAAAGATVTLTGRPQKIFRTDRVLFTEGTANDGTLLSLLAGVDPIMVGNGGAPIAAFVATAFDVGMRGRTLTPAMDVSALIQSTAGSVRFSGVIFGEYAE